MKIAVALLMLVLPGISLAQDSDLSGDEFLIFKWVNQERARYNLPALKWDDHLRDSARKHSANMAEQNQMSHQLPGEPKLMDRVAATGAHMDRVAENVAFGDSALEIWGSWMRSPPHRENILSPDMNAIGVGLARAGTRIYATQNFAHIIEKSSTRQAGADVGKAFNQLRISAGLAPVSVIADREMNAAACAMGKNDRLDASTIPHEAGTSQYVVFTAPAAEQLPNQLQAAAHLPNLHRLLVGTCFMASKSYPGGIYWITAAY